MGFSKTSEHHLMVMGLVTDAWLEQQGGEVTFQAPDENVIGAANRYVSDRTLRAAGLLGTSGVGGGPLSLGASAVPVNTDVASLTSRPQGNCFICWQDPSVCKGYGSKQGYHCRFPFHLNNAHHLATCKSRHVWASLGGPRVSKCGAHETWPLATLIATDGKIVPTPKSGGN